MRWFVRVQTSPFSGAERLAVDVTFWFSDNGVPKAVIVLLEEHRDRSGAYAPAGAVRVVNVERLEGAP